MRVAISIALIAMGLWWAAMFFLALAASNVLPRYGAGSFVHTAHFLAPAVGLLSCAGVGFWFRRDASSDRIGVATGILAIATLIVTVNLYFKLVLTWFFSVLGAA